MLINTNRDLIQPLSSRRNILPVHLNLQLVVWKLRKLNIFARRGDKYAEHSPVDLKIGLTQLNNQEYSEALEDKLQQHVE